MDCMLFTIESRVPLMRLSLSFVWHLSLPWMNSFNKTEAVIFPVQTMLPKDFPIFSDLLKYIPLVSLCCC